MIFHVKFHPSGLPRTGQKVCGGWVGGWWVAECEFSVLLWSKPFSLDLGFGLGPSRTKRQLGLDSVSEVNQAYFSPACYVYPNLFISKYLRHPESISKLFINNITVLQNISVT